MQEYIEESSIKRIVAAIVCDKCGKRMEYSADIFDFQESHTIDFTGGYGSVFGDGLRVQCDLCQHCLKALIDDFARYTED